MATQAARLIQPGMHRDKKDAIVALSGAGYAFCMPYAFLRYGLFVRPDLAHKVRGCNPLHDGRR